jgi:serine/threonine protein kinase
MPNQPENIETETTQEGKPHRESPETTDFVPAENAAQANIAPPNIADGTRQKEPANLHSEANHEPSEQQTLDPPINKSDEQATLAEETQLQRAAIDTSRSDEPFLARSEKLTGEFGRYVIERLLGEGAMGSVYLARDTQLNRQVALKVPKQSAMATDNCVQRFYREARAAAILNHPGICPVYDVGELQGRHYLTMGFIDGRPLDLYVEKNKNQPERRVVGVVRKLALALQEAHDKGIIHRDLKPANIMIDKRNEPIVMDFGLARQTDQQEARLTREGAVMGSPAYMSPEQVKGLPDIGPPTDIYSLGVVLYELLTGSTPFNGTIATVIGHILHTEATPVSERRPDISPELADICHKSMAKSVDERYSSMKEFSADLAKFLSGKSTSASTYIADSAATISADEVETQRKRATKLLKTENFSEAVEVLSTLSGLQGEANSQIAEWASAKLPTAEKKLNELEEEGRSLVRRAKKCMENSDFDRALQLINRIPEQLSGHKKIADMRAEAQELSDEMAQLSLIIQSPDSIDQLELTNAVERLLELKPDHRQANDLYDRLSQQQAAQSQAKRKKKKQSKKSKKTPAYVWVLALLVVVLGGVLIAQSFKKDPPPEDDRVAPSDPDTRFENPPNEDDPGFRAFRPPPPHEDGFRPRKRPRNFDQID